MKKKGKLPVSERQLSLIKQMIRSGKVGSRMVNRLKVVQFSSEGTSNYRINQLIGLQKNRVGIWRNRWAKNVQKLTRLEKKHKVSDSDLRRQILNSLSDKPRCGCPAWITLSQKNQIVALACEKPEDHGVPISQWNLSLLRGVVKEKNIVKKISRSTVGEIIKKTSTPSCEGLDVSPNW